MALQTLGTTSTIILRALSAWSESLSDADIAAIAQSITGDGRFASRLGGGPAGATGILATGATHASTLLDTLVATGGAALAQIQPGMLVLGAGIPPGTFVAAQPSATSVTLSQAATASAAIRVAFVPPPRPMLQRNGMLDIPGRGLVKVLPGDIVAIDNTGWPILVSGAAIGYAGSQWTLT